MPTTIGPDVRTVADIIQVLTKCSKSEADSAELEICKSPSAVSTLLAACGIASASVGFGGRLVIAGVGTYGSTVIPGLLLTGAGIMGARKYCKAAIDKTKTSLGNGTSNDF
jgi:hypothetical protein